MATGAKLVGLGVAAALLATAMPAEARPRYGHGWGSPGYGWGHGGYRHRDRFDFGDFLLGAVIVGGIAAVASDAVKNRDGRRERSAPASGDQEAAADTCAVAAERQAGRYSRDARVTDITSVSRDGEGWRVEGVVSSGDDRSYREERRFQCGVRYGEVDFLQLGDELAVR